MVKPNVKGLSARRFIIFILTAAVALCCGSGYSAPHPAGDIDYSQFHDECSRKDLKMLVQSAWKAVIKEHYDSAAAYYSVAASRYSESLSREDVHRCAASCANMGYIWLSWRMNAAESYPWLMRAKQIAERHNMRDVESAVISNLGQIYFDYNNIPKARGYLQNAFEMVQEDHDDRYYGRSFVDYALVVMFDPQSPMSEESLKKITGYKINPRAPLADYTAKLAFALQALNDGKPREAAIAMDEATPLMNPDSDRKRYLSQHFMILGHLWMQAHEYEKASQAIRKSTEISKGEGLFNLLEKGYTLLEECARHTSDQSLVEQYQHEVLHIRDSLFSASRFEAVKDLEIADQLTSLNESVRQATEQADTQRRRIWLTTGISLALILIIVWIYMKHRRLREAYREIFKRNMELSEKTHPVSPAPAAPRPTDPSDPVSTPQENGSTPESGQEPDRTSSETEQEMLTLMTRIRTLMENDREIYNPDFSIERMANMLDSREKLISQTINTITGKNYSTLLGEYRIREACRLLADPETLRSATMESVAERVGYKSRTYFSTIFKNVTGLTPTQFVKQARDAAKNA